MNTLQSELARQLMSQYGRKHDIAEMVERALDELYAQRSSTPGQKLPLGRQLLRRVRKLIYRRFGRDFWSPMGEAILMKELFHHCPSWYLERVEVVNR